ncbi:hypothetical protein TthSNM11_25140 (plasmid) [Thermus thermophilus]|nr:hypothetical protein TthSNM11_25140 [Thermus thermophilus]
MVQLAQPGEPPPGLLQDPRPEEEGEKPGEKLPGHPPFREGRFLAHAPGEARVGQEPAGLPLPPALGPEEGVPPAQEPPVGLPVQGDVPQGEEGEQGLGVAAPLPEEAFPVQGQEPAGVEVGCWVPKVP